MAYFDVVERRHVLAAISDLDENREHKWGTPTKYNLRHNGQVYAPKAVLGLAFEHATDAPPNNLYGGEGSSHANTVLRSLDFEIISISQPRYWLTTHWPRPKGQYTFDKPLRDIWLKEGTQDQGTQIQPGDKVFIYESLNGQTFTEEQPDGTTIKFGAGKGRQGIVSVGEVDRKFRPDGVPQPHTYSGGKTKWWRWKALTAHHNDEGFVPREEVHKVIGGHPNLLGLGKGSGLAELTFEQYINLLAKFKERIRPVPSHEKPKRGFGGGGESEAHKRLKNYVADHPETALGEKGLTCVKVEYSFCTGDRIDVLLEDQEGKPVAVEIELSQNASQKEGFLQAIKYRALICAHWDRDIDGGRAILVAHELANEIIDKCHAHNVEPHIIPLSQFVSGID